MSDKFVFVVWKGERMCLRVVYIYVGGSVGGCVKWTESALVFVPLCYCVTGERKRGDNM